MISEQQTLSSTSKSCEACGAEILLENCTGKTKKLQAQIFLRTKFCSANCKMRQVLERNAVFKICPVCKTSFKTLACRKSTYCSRACKYENLRAAAPPDDIRICLCCNKKMRKRPHDTTKFCSKECYNTSTKHPDMCAICKNEFLNRRSSKKKKFCSRACANAALSNGATKIYIRGRTGYRTDLGWELYFKSSLEADFARLMKWLGYSFFYEKTTFQIGTRYYTPDFTCQS